MRDQRLLKLLSDDYISYGSDNNYYGEIIERYLGSPTNCSLY